MDKNKFTKGKWSVDKSGYRTKNGGICIMNDNECVAVVGDGNPHHPIHNNALLISKAPEMLEMLEKIADGFDDSKKHLIIKKVEKLIKEATEL